MILIKNINNIYRGPNLYYFDDMIIDYYNYKNILKKLIN